MSGTNLTSNMNMLSPTGFKLTVNKEMFANTEFFITSFGIPSVTSNEVQPNFRGQSAYTPGESLTYDTLSLRFAIDEDMLNYTEVYDWLKSNTRAEGEGLQRHDMILSIMSSHNNVNKQFQFKDAFPTSLSGVEFSTQTSEVEYLQADVTFRFNEFVIIK
jgi:hypothetical protein